MNIKAIKPDKETPSLILKIVEMNLMIVEMNAKLIEKLSHFPLVIDRDKISATTIERLKKQAMNIKS